MNLLEFCSDHASEINVFTDRQALFLLTLIAQLRNTSRQALLSHVGWREDVLDWFWQKLAAAELVCDDSPFGRENPLRLSTQGMAFVSSLRFPRSPEAKASVILHEVMREVAQASAIGPSLPDNTPYFAALFGDLPIERHPEERDFLMRAREGEREAFEALFRIFGPLVYGQCLAILHNQEDAEDAVQQTFIRLLLRRPHLNDRPIDVLFRVAAHKISMDILQRRHRHPETSLEEVGAEVAEYRPHARLDESEWAYFERPRLEVWGAEAPQEKHAILIEALGKLLPRDRHVLALWIEGMTYNEIARDIDTSVDGVRARLYRAKKLLRDAALGAKGQRQ